LKLLVSLATHRRLLPSAEPKSAKGEVHQPLFPQYNTLPTAVQSGKNIPAEWNYEGRFEQRQCAGSAHPSNHLIQKNGKTFLSQNMH